MTAMFVVCWVLLYGPTEGQKSCTPFLGYEQAGRIMKAIVESGDSYSDLSMAMVTTASGPMAKVVPPSN